jgi:serine/threonine-protein kinase HipA
VPVLALIGLNVPEIHLLDVKGKSVFMIKRFDRYKTSMSNNANYYRIHGISALTAIGAHESDYGTNAKSYADIDNFIRRHSWRHEADREELFKRMVYNALMANTDDHLKNHSFLYNHEKKTFDLSPLYDVMPVLGDRTQVKDSYLSIGDEFRSATITNLQSAYKYLPGLSKELSLEWIDETTSLVKKHFAEASKEARLSSSEESKLMEALTLLNGLI